MDEATLIASARTGDVGAFNELVRLHQNMAYNVALRILGDRDAASDATQDAFLAAFRTIHALRADSFRPWLLRIVTNACYDQLRRRRRRPSELLDNLDVDEDIAGWLRDTAERPDEVVERRELNRVLEEGIQRLPSGMRAVLVLADVQGLKYEEIAEVTGLAVGTVKSRLSRGRAQLRDYLLRSQETLPARYRMRRALQEPARDLPGAHSPEKAPTAGQSKSNVRTASDSEATPSEWEGVYLWLT
jgi:RNA polymerase sigma-70 factor (ECF subfamily)